MKYTICDRCGDNIVVYPQDPKTHPLIRISRMSECACVNPPEEIDLCINCQKALLKWINGEGMIVDRKDLMERANQLDRLKSENEHMRDQLRVRRKRNSEGGA